MHEQTPAQMPKDGGSVSNAIGLEVQGKDTGPVAEVNASIDFLKKFRPGGPWVLIAIVPDGRITTRTWMPKQEKNLREWLDVRGGHENIYFQVNDTGDKSINKKPTKADIVAASWLHVDIDPSGDPSLFQAERKRLAKKLKEFSPPPSLVIDSGNGYQGFWRLSEPVRVANPSEEAWADFERYNRQIEADLGADHCFNVDRIMRLPGTVNVPNKKKRSKGRKPSLSKTVHFEDQTFDLSVFSQAPLLDDGETGDVGRPKVSISGNLPRLSEIDELDNHGEVPQHVKMLCVQGLDPDNPERYSSRSECFWYVLCEMVRCEIPDDIIASVMLDPDFLISGHVLDQKNPNGYMVRQLQRAHECAKNFVTDKDGKPVASLYNLRIALARRNLPLWWDEHADQTWLGENQLSDNIERDLRFRLAEEDRLAFSPGMFRELTSQIAFENRRHPLRERLLSLTWDGKPRIEAFLIDNAEADDNAYVRTVTRLWFLAGARRALEPGCKFDELVILESPQGGMKSSAMERLAFGPKWFTDAMPLDGNSKIAIEQTLGKWICEVADMQGRSKDDNRLKAFLSRTHDRARLAYDRRAVDVPRSWIPIGTTNDDRYLTDSTGNRRFWPVRVGRFQLGFDPEQLWAEAVARRHEEIRMPPELWDLAAEQQRERETDDPWADQLQQLFGDKELRIPCTAIYTALGIAPERKKEKASEIGKTMRRLGFERLKSQWVFGKCCNAWVRGDDPKDFEPLPPGELPSGSWDRHNPSSG